MQDNIITVDHFNRYQTNWLTFGGDPVPDTDSVSQFHFPLHCGIGDLLAFLIQSPSDFHNTRRNDWRRKGNECTTFLVRSGRHRVNREIWIGILDHFWLRLDALAEVCALWVNIHVPCVMTSSSQWHWLMPFVNDFVFYATIYRCERLLRFHLKTKMCLWTFWFSVFF